MELAGIDYTAGPGPMRVTTLAAAGALPVALLAGLGLPALGALVFLAVAVLAVICRVIASGEFWRKVTQVMSRVPAPDDEERDRDQRGGEGHEDAGLDELERPEPVARLVGRERAIAEVRQARECGAYLLSLLLA